MSDDDFYPLPDEIEPSSSPVQNKSDYRRESREELDWSLETMVDQMFPEEHAALPDDGDDTLTADLQRAAYQSEESQHKRTLEAENQKKWSDLDQNFRRTYGVDLATGASQLAAAHDRLMTDPQSALPELARLATPEYARGQQQQRQQAVLQFTAEWCQQRNIPAGSTLERHMGAVLGSREFQRTNNWGNDLERAYRAALRSMRRVA